MRLLLTSNLILLQFLCKFVNNFVDVISDPNLLKRDQPSKETLANLQKVYLTSKGTNPIIRPKRQQELQEQEPEQKAASKNPSVSRNAATEKKLPKSTEEVKYPYYGFEEPYIIPKGKLSLRQALDLIGKYQQDEEKWNVEVLSEEFKLDVDTTRNIVTHFRAFQIHLPASLNKGEEVGRLGKVKNFVGQQFLPDGKRPEKDKGNVR